MYSLRCRQSRRGSGSTGSTVLHSSDAVCDCPGGRLPSALPLEMLPEKIQVSRPVGYSAPTGPDRPPPSPHRHLIGHRISGHRAGRRRGKPRPRSARRGPPAQAARSPRAAPGTVPAPGRSGQRPHRLRGRRGLLQLRHRAPHRRHRVEHPSIADALSAFERIDVAHAIPIGRLEGPRRRPVLKLLGHRRSQNRAGHGPFPQDPPEDVPSDDPLSATPSGGRLTAIAFVVNRAPGGPGGARGVRPRTIQLRNPHLPRGGQQERAGHSVAQVHESTRNRGTWCRGHRPTRGRRVHDPTTRPSARCGGDGRIGPVVRWPRVGCGSEDRAVLLRARRRWRGGFTRRLQPLEARPWRRS